MMSFLNSEGQKMGYVDRGQGEIVLFVHGTPTNSNEYETIIKELSGQYRCIAVDHLGFGQSDKPQNGDYSLNAHRARLELFIQHLGVDAFHLLVHDFGGIIGLPLIASPKYQIKSVTILNSWLWPLCETEPSLTKQRWAVTTGLLPFLYRRCNFSAKFLLKMAWGSRKPLTKTRHQFYVNQFPTRRDREGAVGFMNALFEFENSSWQQGQVLAVLKNKPVQIIWGLADKLISPRNLARWKAEIPQASIHELDNVGHFVAEEAADEVAIRLKHWIGLHS